jgi:hypothetical protein
MNPIILTALTVENNRRVAAGLEVMSETEAAAFEAAYIAATQQAVANAVEKAVYKGVHNLLDGLFGLNRKVG